MEPVEQIVHDASLAPSSHNTQPWRFHWNGRSLELRADRSRALPVNDPDDRELTISCGAALFNARLSARHLGLAADITLLPDPQAPELLARLDLARGGDATGGEEALFAAISRRRTYRKPFDGQPLSPRHVQELTEAAEAEGAWLHPVHGAEGREAVMALVAEGDRLLWSDPAWRQELAAWMHPARRRDGLPTPPGMAPLQSLLIKRLDMGTRQAPHDVELARRAPLIAVLGTDGEGAKHWLEAGQALERVLLVAATQGLQASYLNQPNQVASLRPKLREALGVTGFPQLVLRFGFGGKRLRSTPRRRVSAILDA